jgi:hypothetical protein
MKRLVLGFVVFLVLALGLVLTFTPAAATRHEGKGDHHITFSSSPRFPVVAEGAELTFQVSQGGRPVEGLVVMVLVAKAEEAAHAGHGVGTQVRGEHDGHGVEAQVDGGHSGHGAEAQVEEKGEAEHSMTAREVSPGVYVVEHTFAAGGKYAVTAQVGTEAEEFAVAIRSRPVAWSLVVGLLALTVGVAGVVGVTKTVKREW